MQTLEAIRAMMAEAQLSGYGLSRAMGRADSFVSVLFAKHTEPSAALLAELAQACGYRLTLTPTSNELPNDALEVDPQPRG